VDAIKGSELQIPDAIFAWVLDGQGGVSRVLSPARASRTLLGSSGVAASQSALSLWV
jgi:hypothetical protein